MRDATGIAACVSRECGSYCTKVDPFIVFSTSLVAPVFFSSATLSHVE